MFGIMWFRKIKRVTGDEDKDFVTVLHNPDGSVHTFPDVESASRFATESKFHEDMRVVCLESVKV
jgi:hypothetical protein